MDKKNTDKKTIRAIEKEYEILDQKGITLNKQLLKLAGEFCSLWEASIKLSAKAEENNVDAILYKNIQKFQEQMYHLYDCLTDISLNYFKMDRAIMAMGSRK